ncbi:MAG: UDP-N-acetylmuramoyl-L-alanine--D-glutamate ligase [Candidatus Pacebacteria bacterium]|nr:UDP-N-acetylmuramoyl-L-alanine--D-glutamate ligase [Candidatus Paceibacterota bacterium]MBP9840744.1 UDP-N-acetylmuramoyl-L-alanine--D-glutamate ligase [Candidatus Paceibacterota bacterium]
MDASSHFRGKKVTLMGLGLLGRGVGDAKYLAECGAELIVTDLKTKEQLAESVDALSSFSNITFILGEHRLEDFRARDMVLKAAGVPFDSIYIEEARKNNIPVRMSADLFMELSGVTTVGITGTRGKSTTTHMIAAILKEAGKKVLLGGNVRGVSTLALLPQITGSEVAVLELDSWQCQGLGDATISPSVAVFTTLYEDHLNYYKNDMRAYLADKANIFLNQKPEDTLVLGSQCAELIQESYGGDIRSHVTVVGDHDLRADWKLAIPGEHNRYDAALAVEAARALGIPDESIEKALATFPGVPGRLEFIREVNGVRVYNDTTATTPEATVVALRALAGEKPNIILIMGGADKGLVMNALFDELPNVVKHVVLLAGTGTDRIRSKLPAATIYATLDKAVDAAFREAEAGDTILMSPAFASFGMFKNEYDRGDQFNALVKNHA